VKRGQRGRKPHTRSSGAKSGEVTSRYLTPAERQVLNFEAAAQDAPSEAARAYWTGKAREARAVVAAERRERAGEQG
jgi:hypothetical protein